MPKAITISPSPPYHSLLLHSVPTPTPEANEVLVKITAAALNHRDLFIRQNLYPSISFKNPLLADGCGILLTQPSSKPTKTLLPNSRVIINPGTGWISDPTGPEGKYTVIGGTSTTPLGTLQDMIALPAEDVEAAPEHLTDAEAAALPLAGLTAWRAFNHKSGSAAPGRNILVTGIGGGVAIMVLLFAVAIGCNVYVTSSSEEKLARARELGARGGVLYTNEDGWVKALGKMLPRNRPTLDAIIDGAGGDIVQQTWKLLKIGGTVVCYGQTTLGQPTLPMQGVMKNIELKGSTMGSRREFKEMVDFVRDKKIRPVVGRTVNGIENIEGIESLFEDMKEGRQFGKLVVVSGSGRNDISDQTRCRL